MYLLVGSCCADVEGHLLVAVQWQDTVQWIFFCVQQGGRRSLDVSTFSSLTTTPFPAFSVDHLWHGCLLQTTLIDVLQTEILISV